jgi:hypothetical protein
MHGLQQEHAALTHEDHMTSKNAIRRSPFAAAVLATALALAGAARADDDAAARAAAASDPEYKLGYSRAAQGAAYAGECNDKGYAAREEFTKCQEQALQRAGREGHASDATSRMATAGPRDE